MLELRGLTKRFGDLTALGGIDLTVEAGTCVALIGSSGCGKSTLLRMAIGLERPDAGQVVLQGAPLPTESHAIANWRRRMGYVIQEGGLFPHLDGRGNVALQARYFGWAEDCIAARIDSLRQLVHLPADCLERYPRQLSGGQRQRLSLMRALMLDPDVLLLDEPLGALDPMIRSELQRDLRQIFRRLGKTVLLVTHDVAEARYLGDRLVLMAEGQILQQGTYGDLYSSPATPFVRDFLAAQRPLLDEDEAADTADREEAS